VSRVFVETSIAAPIEGLRAGVGTLMTDDWTHWAPFGVIGRIVDAVVFDRYLRRQLIVWAKVIGRFAEGEGGG
jgi:hypothetical protein